MKTYFAYIRVSTVRQGEKGSSLQEQKDAIRAYAATHGLSIVEWFEEMETAAKQGRQLFTRMIASLEKGGAAGVILHKVDRGARNLWDWARLQGLLDLGVEVHFVHESLDLNSRGGRLSANLQAVIAADYIWNLRDEVRKGVTGRLKQGLYPLPAPVGYLDRGKGQPKVIDPVKGPLVRHAFELYATGRYNFRTLCKELHELGFRSRRGNRLAKASVTGILRNPFYIGLIRIRCRREVYQGVHEPLISKTLFDRVQVVLDGRINARAVKYEFLFRRLLTCAHCGYALVGETQKGHVYYRCHTVACPTRGIRQEEVEAQIREVFGRLQIEPSTLDILRSEVTKFKAAWGESREKRIRSAQLLIRALDERLERLTDALLDQLLDRDSYSQRREALLHERTTLMDRIRAISEGTTSPADECERFLEQVSSLWLSYESGFPHEKRELIELATSNRTVDGKNVAITLRMPFRIFFEQQKLTYCDPHRDEVRTGATELARQLLAYFSAGTESAEQAKPTELPHAA